MEPNSYGRYLFGIHFLPIFLFLRLFGKKIILTHHSIYDEKEIREYIETSTFRGLLGRVVGLLYSKYVKISLKLLSKLADKSIVLSLREYEILKRLVQKNKIVYMPHGFKPEKVKVEFKKINENKKINLLLFGFIRPEKGYELAIEAMNYLPNNFRLIVAGSIQPNHLFAKRYFDFLTKKIEEIKKVGKECILINKFIPNEEKKKIFEEADIVLIPYKIIGVSGILNDALNFVKPVVATVLKEDIENYGIGKFSSRDPVEFANKILDVYRNYTIYRRNLLKIRKKFFIDEVVKQHIQIYLL